MSQQKIHEFARTSGEKNDQTMQETLDHSIISKFLPHGRTLTMTQETRGVFIPYPLLGIVVTIAICLIAGLVALEVQVSSLNTTLLLRDADTRAEMLTTKEKLAQLEVYIHSDREKLVKIETQLDNTQRK